jgi:hypothetical protein
VKEMAKTEYEPLSDSENSLKDADRIGNCSLVCDKL